MQQKWEFSDGTTATWVTGDAVRCVAESELAAQLQRRMGYHPRHPCSVRIAPMPGGNVDLDLSNVWLVDAFLRNEAMRLGLQVVSSTYTPKHDDMNAETRRIMERWWNSPPPEPGVDY